MSIDHDTDAMSLLYKTAAETRANNVCIGILLGALKKQSDEHKHKIVKSLQQSKHLMPPLDIPGDEAVTHFNTYIDNFCHALSDKPDPSQNSEVVPIFSDPEED